jgi:hypothetical protein
MTTARSSRPDESGPSIARLVELAVVAPLELGGRLIEAVPAVVDKLPSAAERVRREIVLARFLGKLAVDQGVRELRSRLDDLTAAHAPETDHEGDGDDGEEIDRTPADLAATEHTDRRARDEVPSVATLALADYDHLSSAQIVGKLEGLDDAERAAIERYELAGRHRRTILGKLEQLRAASE